MRSRRIRLALRRTVGLLWLAIWLAVLYTVAAPWRALGGVIDERLRWLEGFVLVVGLSLGFVMGRFGRDFAGQGPGCAHIDVLRCLLYPLSFLTAIALVALTALGRRDPVGVVVTAFLACWAGVDIAFGAVPLMEGRPHGVLRSVDPEPGTSTARRRGEAGWTPPWERL